ncbi:MAG: CheR family methyltransferase [Burkholderiales bacterium]
MKETGQPTLSLPLLARLSEFVAMQTGLYFPQERWSDLERGIAAAAPDFHFQDVASCVRWLLSAPLTRHLNEVLASHLSIGETYFFREQRSLEMLDELVLAPLLQSQRQSGRRLRIWSAGCSTGEEAYTVAILLDRRIPDIKEWDITILATDFNQKFLRKAALGAYGEWSFRDAPDWLRKRYFNKRGDGQFEIDPRIRKMVTFSYLNLVDEGYPSLLNNISAMDVILCRNVLMYFSMERASQVVSNFYRMLVGGGWLLVGSAEASTRLLAPFVPVEFPGAALYRKKATIESESELGEDRVLPSFSEREVASFSRVPATTVVEVAGMRAAQAGQQPLLQGNEHNGSSGMARLCANQGRLGEALEWCNKAIAADKMNPAHHYLQAAILQEQGQHSAAMDSLSRTLYLNPEYILAHFYLGILHQSQGRKRVAERYFRNVLALLSKHPQDEILPETDGMTAGRLVAVVGTISAGLSAAQPQ